MKKIVISLLVILLMGNMAWSQTNKRPENVTIYSSWTEGDTGLNVSFDNMMYSQWKLNLQAYLLYDCPGQTLNIMPDTLQAAALHLKEELDLLISKSQKYSNAKKIRKMNRLWKKTDELFAEIYGIRP